MPSTPVIGGHKLLGASLASFSSQQTTIFGAILPNRSTPPSHASHVSIESRSSPHIPTSSSGIEDREKESVSLPSLISLDGTKKFNLKDETKSNIYKLNIDTIHNEKVFDSIGNNNGTGSSESNINTKKKRKRSRASVGDPNSNHHIDDSMLAGGGMGGKELNGALLGRMGTSQILRPDSDQLHRESQHAFSANNALASAILLQSYSSAHAAGSFVQEMATNENNKLNTSINIEMNNQNYMKPLFQLQELCMNPLATTLVSDHGNVSRLGSLCAYCLSAITQDNNRSDAAQGFASVQTNSLDSSNNNKSNYNKNHEQVGLEMFVSQFALHHNCIEILKKELSLFGRPSLLGVSPHSGLALGSIFAPFPSSSRARKQETPLKRSCALCGLEGGIMRQFGLSSVLSSFNSDHLSSILTEVGHPVCIKWLHKSNLLLEKHDSEDTNRRRDRVKMVTPPNESMVPPNRKPRITRGIVNIPKAILETVPQRLAAIWGCNTCNICNSKAGVSLKCCIKNCINNAHPLCAHLHGEWLLCELNFRNCESIFCKGSTPFNTMDSTYDTDAKASAIICSEHNSIKK